MYTVGSLFSGIGGFDLAAAWAGFKTSWFVEKEPFCQQVLHRHWPGVPVYGDIYETHDLPYVDVITAGFPCQPFSVAGQRRGVEDERFLIPEMMRVIRDVKPTVVFLENVPGFASLNDGAEFKLLLRAFAESGYDAQWQHLRASDVDAPHRRERWFCVVYGDRLRCNAGRPEQSLQGVGKYGSTQSLADATTQRLQKCQQSTGWQNTAQNGTRLDNRLERHGEDVGNTESGRLQGNWAGEFIVTPPRCCETEFEGASSQCESLRATEPRLGGTTHGLPSRLDFPGFPAPPTEVQYPYEPPRTVPGKQAHRAARIKALGNAVVPQVVYPVLVAIHEWLDAQVDKRR